LLFWALAEASSGESNCEVFSGFGPAETRLAATDGRLSFFLSSKSKLSSSVQDE
jgi:hypothetical protein